MEIIDDIIGFLIESEMSFEFSVDVMQMWYLNSFIKSFKEFHYTKMTHLSLCILSKSSVIEYSDG